MLLLLLLLLFIFVDIASGAPSYDQHGMVRSLQTTLFCRHFCTIGQLAGLIIFNFCCPKLSLSHLSNTKLFSVSRLYLCFSYVTFQVVIFKGLSPGVFDSNSTVISPPQRQPGTGFGYAVCGVDLNNDGYVIKPKIC